MKREASNYRFLASVVARVAGDRELLDILSEDSGAPRKMLSLDDTEAIFRALASGNKNGKR